MKLLFLSLATLMFSITINAQAFSLGDCSSAANPNNPVDIIGVQHNTSLEYVMNNLNEQQRLSSSTTFSTTSQFVERSLGRKFNSIADRQNAEQGINYLFNSINKIKAPTKADFLGVLNLSKPAKNHLDVLISYIYGNTSIGFAATKNTIISWEGQIKGLGLSAQETEALYTFGSTIRYSYLGWENANVRNTTPAGQAGKLRLFGWIVTAICDAVGATIGALGSGGAAAVICGAAGSGMGAAVSAHNGW